MALKFNLEVDKKAVEEAKQDRGGRYTGPTPQPDLYKVKLKEIISSTDKNDNPILNAVLEINETGDKEVYNGCGIYYRLNIPVDKTYQYYTIQVNVLQDFLQAAFGMDILEFGKLASAGKILTRDKQTRNGDDLIKSIGKYKVDSANEFVIKTKNSEYNGKTYVNVHYIDLDATETPNSSDSDDVDFDDDEGIDLDSLDDEFGDE